MSSFDFEYKRSLDLSQPTVEKVHVAANQTIVAGNLLVVSSGRAAKAAAAAAYNTVLGVALADITTGGSVGDDDVIPVLILTQYAVLRATYLPGVSKTSLAAGDKFGTMYDIDVNGATGKQTVNLGDTEGGFLKVVGYDNDNKTVDVIVAAGHLWNSCQVAATGD